MVSESKRVSMSRKQKNSSKANQEIRIRLKAFECQILDKSSETIIGVAKKSGARIIGPIPLPVKKKVWCVLKSPHVNKRGGEHYEIRIHSRLLSIVDPPSSAMEALMRVNLPAGVDIEVKILDSKGSIKG